MAEKVFTDGMIIKWLGPNDPNRRQNAPDFILGQVSFKVQDFINCLQANTNNGWMNVDIKRSQGGKVYAEVDTWKPKGQQAQQQQAPPPQDTRDYSDPPFVPTDDIPF